MLTQRQIATIGWLTDRWYIAIALCFVLGVLVLLPGLDKPGLWEPQERSLSDRLAPPLAVQRDLDAAKAKTVKPPVPQPVPQAQKAKPETCRRAAPEEPVARSLTNRAIVGGRDGVSDSDGGRRFPLAILGLLTLLATAGIAMRAGSGRAGIVGAIVLVAMPMFVLQSRMLTSEIGTACGAALIIYGLLALRRLGDLVRSESILALSLAYLDTWVGAVALLAGTAIGFVSGGALLGLLVPFGAYAAAGKLGVPAIADGVRAIYNVGLWIARKIQPRWGAGRSSSPYKHPGSWVALLATLVAAGLIALLAYQLYELEEPILVAGRIPPAREVLGVAVLPEGCWSWALGGLWRPEDDLRYIYDSTFEQIAYGTFPWGILGPIAALMLLRDPDAKRRAIGALALAWTAAAWIATEAFQRKVGFVIWSGFPALAVAIAVWLDGVMMRRRSPEPEAASALPAGVQLLGVFFFLAVLDIGKDIQAFPEKLTSLLVGSDTIAYPVQARVVDASYAWWVPLIGIAFGVVLLLVPVLFVRNARWRVLRLVLFAVAGVQIVWPVIALILLLPAKRWVLLLGLFVGLGFALSMIVWRAGDDHLAKLLRRASTICLAVALATSVVIAAFWSFIWQPRLALHLSSKSLFETYEELRGKGDALVIFGDLGHAPKSYTDTAPEMVSSREQIVTALKRPDRVFAIAPQSELCSLHREIGDKPYFVVEDRNTRNLLLSNRVDGTTDKNPLASMIAHVEPKGIKSRPKARVVWDNRIELLGWEIPSKVERGRKFDVVMYYKILQPVGGNWTAIMHFDGAIRFNGDHKPIKDRCPTSTWQLGDFIIDRHTVVAGNSGHPLGRYELWIGFFTGSAPNFRNMPISEAPGDIRDATDRVKITTVVLQ